MEQARRDIEEILADNHKQADLNNSGESNISPKWIQTSLGILILFGILFLSLRIGKGYKKWKENPSQMKKRTLYQTNTFLFLSPWLFVFLHL